jgi:hypothetical protein
MVGGEVMACDQLEENAKYLPGCDRKSKAVVTFWKLFKK